MRKNFLVGSFFVCCALAFADGPSLDELNQSAKVLESQARQLGSTGKLDVYGRMRVKLVARFLDYLKIDIQNNRKELSSYAARDLARLIAEETARLKAIAAGTARPVDSPRRVKTEYPKIVAGHLEQPVQWADGKIENRPVFLFGFGHVEGMKRDVEWLADLGMNFCQIDTYMPAILPREGEWNAGVVSQYRSFLTQAQNAGVLVDVLIAPHYMPDWAFQKHPDWKIHLGGFLGYPINQPEVMDLIGGFSERMVRELAPAKNFWSCCLINEPAFFFWGSDPDTRRLWRSYLISQHGTIEHLNQKWGTEYKSWNEIPIYANPNEDNYQQPPGSYDWMRFNDERIANWIEWLGGRVHAGAKDKLTHAKLCDHYFAPYDIMQGVDPYLISRVTDLAGKDSTGDPPLLFVIDSLLRRAAERPVFNSENHFMGDGSTNDVLPGEIRSSFWLQGLGGLDASAAWIWDRNDADPNSPFIGLWQYRPGPTEEYFRTGLDLMRVMPDMIALREKPIEVAVLYSRVSVLRNSKHTDALRKTAGVLLELGIPFSAVNEQMLSAGQVQKRLTGVKVLILPGVKYLADDGLDALPWVEQAGIKLVAVGKEFAAFNAYNKRRTKITVVPDTLPNYEAKDFPQLLSSRLEKAGVRPDIRPVDPKTRQPVQGLIWRTVRKDNRILATAVNTGNVPVTCSWIEGNGKPFIFNDQLNLVPLKPATELRLQPHDVVFGILTP
jgi:hypothetical protein